MADKRLSMCKIKEFFRVKSHQNSSKKQSAGTCKTYCTAVREHLNLAHKVGLARPLNIQTWVTEPSTA